jgi:hypothetical protein
MPPKYDEDDYYGAYDEDDYYDEGDEYDEYDDVPQQQPTKGAPKVRSAKINRQGNYTSCLWPLAAYPTVPASTLLMRCMVRHACDTKPF